MSSKDDNNCEDVFRNIAATATADVPQLLTQPPPPPVMWSNQMMGTQFVQAQLPSQPQHQQQQQQQHQQQHYNEYVFNMYAASAGQPETYSVLPVGHGNFLKVYHCPENSTSGLASEGGLYHRHTNQSQPQFQQHHQAPYNLQTHNQQIFNSYELFSANPLMSTADNQTNTGQEISQQPQPQPQPQPQAPQQPPMLLLSNLSTRDEHSTQGNSTNMIINKLVNNWSPNLTGGTYMQFGAPITQLPAQTPEQNTSNTLSPAQAILPDITNPNSIGDISQATQPAQNYSDLTPSTTTSITQQDIVQQQQKVNVSVVPITRAPVEMLPSNNISYKEAVVNTTATSGSAFLTTGSANNVHPPEVKKRIVAEVKPMRMTYSDVLSKLNSQQSAPIQHLNVKQNVIRNDKKVAVGAQLQNERKGENKLIPEPKNGTSNARRQAASDEANNQDRSIKKSPTHENKENVQQTGVTGNKNSKRSNNSVYPSNSIANHQKTTQKSSQKHSNSEPVGKKRMNNKRDDVEYPAECKSSKANGSEKEFSAFYNVAEKTKENNERSSKLTFSTNGNSNTNSRKLNKSSSSYCSNSHASNTSSSFVPNQNRSRYNNTNSNSSSSYSYSSKRNRGSNSSYASYGSSPSPSSNRNYELAKKFLRAWLEYTLKILTWLFYLVYDIVVLGCSMVYDHLLNAYDSGLIYVQQLRKEFNQNSYKPSIWLKNACKRFDARFKKNSKWAFWRYFCKKKTLEPSTETFKNGRLPQTGEEAMFSLLNCKGKDAYSVLGVPPDSSQEQIRKHYKKIAVLVHPDKNKQAGAEEAFKVLQRAFELIGEPENRLAYDQSLAEALHAEKAWTELHDLLSQLQTKITEAANTIRCSTCGLRHPRKITDRPHYAARECASCKIRHTAREGDIWAETSLLGLRWKYLALMEGKVYDITEWANCQKGALSHLEPNSHMVQYRIVRGAQQQQQQQQQQQHNQQQQQQQQSHQHNQHHSPHHSQQYPGSGSYHERGGSGKFKRDIPPSEASLHEFLDNLYSGQNPNQNNTAAYSNSSRRRNRRN